MTSCFLPSCFTTVSSNSPLSLLFVIFKLHLHLILPSSSCLYLLCHNHSPSITGQFKMQVIKMAWREPQQTKESQTWMRVIASFISLNRKSLLYLLYIYSLKECCVIWKTGSILSICGLVWRLFGSESMPGELEGASVWLYNLWDIL